MRSHVDSQACDVNVRKVQNTENSKILIKIKGQNEDYSIHNFIIWPFTRVVYLRVFVGGASLTECDF